MARKVYVSSDMSNCEKLYNVAKVNPKAALMWPWFLTALDDWGRTDASPHKLKTRMFPDWSGVSRNDIEKALQLYADKGLIVLYRVGEDTFASVDEDNWKEYQTHIRWDRKGNAESKIPAYEPNTVTVQDVPGVSRIIPPSPSPSLSPSKTYVQPKGGTTDGFDTFWERYPRKEGKGQARRAWSAAIKKADEAAIMAGLAANARERKYRKLPASWLNGECWNDETEGTEQNAVERKKRIHKAAEALRWAQRFKHDPQKREDYLLEAREICADDQEYIEAKMQAGGDV